jgi:Recombination endonuclease VII
MARPVHPATAVDDDHRRTTPQQAKARRLGQKWCSRCDTTHPLTAFYADRHSADGYRVYCKPCYRHIRHASRDVRRAAELRRKFGLTPEAYDTMLAAQHFRCAICQTVWRGGSRRFHVDHDHATGTIRGLLCGRCNTVLGALHEDPKEIRRILVAMVDYVSFMHGSASGSI